MTKAPIPSLGCVYADRDKRRPGRRVKVEKLLRKARKALCSNLKSGKRTEIAFATLHGRYRIDSKKPKAAAKARA